MDQVYAELERRHDKALSRAIHILDARYSTLKKVMAVFGVLLTLGTVGGLYGIRHEASVRQQTACWSRHNNASVLKALVNKGGSRFNANPIKDPQLKIILIASQKQGLEFKKFAKKNISIPTCSGHNPNPLSPEILKLINHG